MMMSKTQQQKTVDEGLALGAVMLGVVEVKWELIGTESDFRRAWQEWPYADLFPSVTVSIPRNDLRHILRMSPRRLGPRVTGWSERLEPWADDDDWDGLAAVIHDGIPAASWRDLAQAWLGVSDGD